jgi:hypothetical protein
MTDQQAYDLVASEIQSRQLKPGVWARSLAESAGNKHLAESRYIKLRAEEILAKDRAEQSRIAREQQQEQSKIAKERRTAATRSGFGLMFALLTACCLILSIAAPVVSGFSAEGFVGTFVCILMAGVCGYLAYDCMKK